MTYLFVAASLLASRSVSASGYQDVAVVVNTNSPVSLAIGSYFQTARGIPQINIIPVNTTTDETITDSVFASLRNQIESYLLNNNLADSINYIVTTKGVPLRIDRGDPGATNCASASVESELMCILGPLSAQIGGPGGCVSPYSGQTAHFSHKAYGIYLITRLDGYSLQDVEQLIDKSGPGVPLSPSSSFVLDQDPGWGGIYTFLNANLTKARNIIATNGALAVLDSGTVFLTQEPATAGYASWGSNDHHASEYSNNGSPHNTWVPGAIAETYVSSSARSFMAPPVYGQSLIADMIHEGASGARGYVYEPFATAMADVSILFDRYTSGYNLAESFFSASRLLSWMDVVVGDPKTSIVLSGHSSLPIQLSSFEAFAAGNTSVLVAWTTLSEINNFGFYIQKSSDRQTWENVGQLIHGHGTTLDPQKYSVTLPIAGGSWWVRLLQMDLNGTSRTYDAQLIQMDSPVKFILEQNYPNPFNPATTIRYGIPRQSAVTLNVFNTLGQKVASLVNEVQTAGYHDAKFDASGLASGLYFYRIQAGDFVQAKRLLLLR